MTDTSQWQTANDAHLEAALLWLRLRLAQQAGPLPAGMIAAPSKPERRGWFRRENPPGPADLPPTKTVSADEVAEAATALAARENVDPPPALIILARRFELSTFERQVLLLCAAMELDTRIAALCARARDDGNRPYPTFALALALFEGPTWDALSPERPLRFWRLIEISQPGGQPLTASPLRADERIVSYIKGLNYLDDRLNPLLAPFDLLDDGGELPPSQQGMVDAILRQLKRPTGAPRFPVIQLVGPDSPSKQLIARQAANALGLLLYRLPVGSLPTGAAELDTMARLWQRESMLLPIALYVDSHDSTGAASDAHAFAVGRLLTRIGSLTFLDSGDTTTSEWDRAKSLLVLDVAKPTPSEQQQAWTAALASAATATGANVFADAPARLAGQFNVSLSTIRQLAKIAIADSADASAAAAPPASDLRSPVDRLWDACLGTTRPRLDTLAQRLDAKATWNDIVLPQEAVNLLRQISAQVGQRSKVYEDWGFHSRMNRGLGISALFTGESGTGKTMAAEVIANDLRLNLYRIDLSAVVSKYIGETEKNLRRLFDAAEDGGAILFFDEADALFGKRSEVKDSHDRYANIEINYLLQRMEAYRGLAILATNMKSALDSAFARRLRFVVNFSFPGQAERRAMWQNAFPPNTPATGIDVDRLSRLNLTGGSIHNIALNAAFLAASANTPITMPVVLDAARSELRKLERPINEADFRLMETVGSTP
jgi:ATPase family associated with various cellular activities (AAA)